MTQQQTRILIVEDSIDRIEKIQGWLIDGVQLINARSAGVAMVTVHGVNFLDHFDHFGDR